MKSTTKTIEKYLSKLDSRYSLYYVDYRDDLNEKHHDAIVHEAIQKNSRIPISEAACEWYNDDYEAIQQIISDTYTDAERERIENDETLHQAIIDTIRDRDDSDPAGDLMRNTGSRNFFYSLEIGAPDNATPEDVKDIYKQLQAWKKANRAHFKITRDQVAELLANAYYGGSVGFLFRLDSFALVQEPNEYGYMELSGAQLACIDYVNGSGYDIAAGKVILPLAGYRSKIGIERYYVEDVCGMILEESTAGFSGRRGWSEAEPEKTEYSTSSIGNIIADDITMLHVRSWNQTTCNGQKYERGHLFKFDIQNRKEAPAHVIETLKMCGGWLAQIKEPTPTKNYHCAWIAFDNDGNIVGRKVERAHEYVLAYCEHIKKGTAESRKRAADYKAANKKK